LANIKFEIIKNIGVLSESSSGWTKELNLVSWNDRVTYKHILKYNNAILMIFITMQT